MLSECMVVLLLCSFWFHQWHGFHKPKQVPWEIAVVHVLDWPKWLIKIKQTECLFFRVCYSLILSSVFFFLSVFSSWLGCCCFPVSSSWFQHFKILNQLLGLIPWEVVLRGIEIPGCRPAGSSHASWSGWDI